MPTRRNAATRLTAIGVTVAAALAASLPPGVASAASASGLALGTVATPGSPDSGDSLFPHQGNGGYDVAHYTIQLVWSAPNSIDAVVTITATATQDLSAFNLDFDPDNNLTVDATKVNGVDTPAPPARSGHEMTITPAAPIPNGSTFVTVISYHGSPSYTIDPDGSKDGWVRTADGATVVAEPIGAMTWFPCNNTPRDKASYTFVVSAPQALTVVSNGKLGSRQTSSGTTTWRWQERRQMATYLASISIGTYREIHGRTGAGVPVRSYIDPTIGGGPTARQVPRVINKWSSLFGPYPFETTGITIDNVGVGYALEVQSRPMFPYVPGMGTLVHELAHQWFGDDVTPADWSDIWLNEGFASYAEWLWSAETGHPGAPARAFQQLYDDNPAGSDFWKVPVGDPQRPSQLFRYQSVYLRGAMALQAIRMKMGSKAFFRLLHRWPARYAQSNVSTAQLEVLAEQISGKSLHKVFHDWVYTAGKPRGY